jgi:ferredoxin
MRCVSTPRERRTFLEKLLFALGAFLVPRSVVASEALEKAPVWVLAGGYTPGDHYWGMGIDISKCIGCGRCVAACKTENKVPRDPFFFRTWVERYRVLEDGETLVDSPNGAIDSFENESIEKETASKTNRSKRTSSEASSFRSSAIIATIRPAFRSARSAPPSSRRMAWCWWTPITASAAGTVFKRVPTVRVIFTPKRARPTSAPSAITGSRKA